MSFHAILSLRQLTATSFSHLVDVTPTLTIPRGTFLCSSLQLTLLPTPLPGKMQLPKGKEGPSPENKRNFYTWLERSQVSSGLLLCWIWMDNPSPGQKVLGYK